MRPFERFNRGGIGAVMPRLSRAGSAVGSGSRGYFAAISLLFVLSGATALTYELIWIKRFAQIWGSSSLALATVVACFLLGLGLGAQLFGRIADRLRWPLRWYGYAEVGIGLLALTIPWQLALLARLSGTIEGSLPELTGPRMALRFVVTLLVIGPPSVLMGGTLPLLIRQVTRRTLSDATGWLYGMNTLGAAVGCYLAGFHLLPGWGLVWTNNAAAALNLAIGGVALLLVRNLKPVSPTAAAAHEAATAADPAARWQWQLPVLVAAALTGGAALVLQMVWSRQLAVALGGSTYGYSAALFTVLVGIGLGGLIYHFFLARLASDSPVTEAPSAAAAAPVTIGGERPRSLFTQSGTLRQATSRWETTAAVVAATIAVATVIGQQALPWLCDQVALNRAMRADALGNAVVCVLASMALQLVPSIGAGVLFPLLVQVTRQSAAHVGRVVGNVYLWNTGGAIVGASLTALVLFPAIGTAGATAVAIAGYALAVLLLWPRPQARFGALAWLCVLGCLACMNVAVGWPLAIGGRPDPRLTDYGMYLYGYSPRELRLESGDILLFEEGTSLNVLALDTYPNRTLRVNGKVDASDGLDIHTQLGLAYFPRAFKADAEDVLVIGYGSGASAGASLLFGDTRVVCCEIEPAVFAASPLFGNINHAADESPRLEMVFDDGRSYLQRTGRQFDLIISEPSNPWIAGVGNLFTREFFQAAQRHLRPGGVLSQWAQSYQFSVEEYALIVRTLRSVFPHCGVISLAGGVDTILLASDEPLVFGADEQTRLQALIAASPAIEDDLVQFFGSTDFRSILLRQMVADEAGLDQFLAEVGPGPLNTDVNMRLEFSAPLRMFGPALDEALSDHIVGLQTSAWLETLAEQMGVDRDGAIYAWALSTQAMNEQRTAAAIEHLQRALELDPGLIGAYYQLIRIYRDQGQLDKAIALAEQLLPLRPHDARLRVSVAVLLSEQAQQQRAIELYREALAIKPDSTLAQMNLAWLLATAEDESLRDEEEAVRWAQQACEATRYRDGGCLDVLAAALAAQGDYARAAHLALQAVERLAAMGQRTDGAQARLNHYNAQLAPVLPPE